MRYGLGAWTEHIFFAYDLVAQLKPRVLVELGTDRGESYFAFCQSALENQTRTRCFAVDHWRGDPHAGSYDEATFIDVDRHNRKHYEAFSTLLRMSFAEALAQFAPESIDLLHIDGHHTEEAVRQDVESWLPKLRPGGILLIHDVAVRGRGFGVWKVWEELGVRGRAFAFSTPPGLGVWQKPGLKARPRPLRGLRYGAGAHPSRMASNAPGGRSSATPPAEFLPTLLETLFNRPSESRSALLSFYRERNQALQERIAQQWRDGSIRSAPMASETVIQIFWRGEGGYSEEQSTDARIGHGDWKEVAIPLPAQGPEGGLRIDFFSALTRIEIALIEVVAENGAAVYRAEEADAFGAISLSGDCVALSLTPFVIEVTGVDPQLHLPPFSRISSGLTVRMRLRVLSTL